MKMIAIAAMAAFFASSAGAMTPGFDGATIQYQYRFPNLSSPIAAQSAVIGSGVEFLDYPQLKKVRVGGPENYIEITDLLGFAFAGASFNGIVLSDVNNSMAPITGVTFAGSQNRNGQNPIVTFDTDNIYFNFASMLQSAPYTIYAYRASFGETSDAVPEPASWLMMIAGFGLTGAAMRGRRRLHPTLA